MVAVVVRSISILIVLIVAIGGGVFAFLNKKDETEIEREGSYENPNTSKLSITPQQALYIADQLEEVMYPTAPTSLTKLFALLKPLNRDDYLLVHKKFGKRAYASWGYGGGGFFDRDLTYWLSHEVWDDNMAQFKRELAHLKVF